MKIARLIVLALTAAALAGLGCRKAHLGPDTGKAFRAALAAQSEAGKDKNPVTFSARDAQQAVDVHYYGPAATGPGGGGGAAVTSVYSGASLPVMSMGSSSSSGSSGSGEGIRLQAH